MSKHGKRQHKFPEVKLPKKEPEKPFNLRLVFLLLAFLGIVVYLNSLGGEFVSDDIDAIVRNSLLGNLWLPLSRFNLYAFSRGLIFLIFGQNVFFYHAFNVFLHISASFLVFLFVQTIIKNQKISLLACLIFLLHPIQTEAVAWISGSGYIFYSIFFLLSFLAFHKALENQDWKYFLASLLFYSLALFASPWAFPLAAVFFLYEIYLKKIHPHWFFYLALILINLFYFLNMQTQTSLRIASLNQATGGFQNLAITIPHILTQNLLLLFWPQNLTLYHEGEILTSTYLWLARLLVLAAFLIMPFILQRCKLFVFFLLFFLVSISLSLSPLQITWYVAERYLYLGLISFAVLMALIFYQIEDRFKVKNLAFLLLIPLLGFYSLRTIIRNVDWQTPAALWLATAKVSPQSPRVHNNLGDIYGSQGDLSLAIAEFEKARQLQPGYADATHNLGNIYLQKGDLDRSRTYFLEALKYNPNLYQSFFNLGLIEYQKKELGKAQEYFLQALKINPQYEPAQSALAALRKSQ